MPFLIKELFFKKYPIKWFREITIPLIIGGLAANLIWIYGITDKLYHCADDLFIRYGFVFYEKPHVGYYGDWYAAGVNDATMFLIWLGFTAVIYLGVMSYALLKVNKKSGNRKFVLVTFATLGFISLISRMLF